MSGPPELEGPPIHAPTQRHTQKGASSLDGTLRRSTPNMDHKKNHISKLANYLPVAAREQQRNMELMYCSWQQLSSPRTSQIRSRRTRNDAPITHTPRKHRKRTKHSRCKTSHTHRDLKLQQELTPLSRNRPILRNTRGKANPKQNTRTRTGPNPMMKKDTCSPELHRENRQTNSKRVVKSEGGGQLGGIRRNELSKRVNLAKRVNQTN